MAFFSCCLRIAIFVLVWVAACDAAPRASVDAYFFSLFAHCHVFIYTSYLNAPLAFPPDSWGCLGLPRTWLVFPGLAAAGASGSISFSSLSVSFEFPGWKLFSVGPRIRISGDVLNPLAPGWICYIPGICCRRSLSGLHSGIPDVFFYMIGFPYRCVGRSSEV